MAFTYNRKSLKKNPTNFSSKHMRICVKDATHLIEYAGGHFSEQGDYLFRLPLLDCLYRFPTKKARGITGSYMLIYS